MAVRTRLIAAVAGVAAAAAGAAGLRELLLRAPVPPRREFLPPPGWPSRSRC